MANQKGSLVIILAVVAVIAIIAGLYIYYLTQQKTKYYQSLQQDAINNKIKHDNETAKTTTNSSPISDQTANWKTYQRKFDTYSFEIKYPEGVNVNELEGLTILYKGVKASYPPGSNLDPYGGLEAVSIYYRNNLAEAEAFAYPNEPKVESLAGYPAIVLKKDNGLDSWIYTENKNNVARVGLYSTSSGNHDLFIKMISTFKFR